MNKNNEISEFSNYRSSIEKIKSVIVKSRYKVVSSANIELLKLYLSIGEYISLNTRNKNWGKGAIDYISSQLQSELNGLRGFSPTNLKNMRLFYEEWSSYLPQNSYETLADNSEFENRQLQTDDLGTTKDKSIEIRQSLTAELNGHEINDFFKISFTHHREIIRNCEDVNERIFYIKQCSVGFWSVEKLKFNIKSNLFFQKGKLQNNFNKTINNENFRQKAINSFRDEILLDFINVSDANDEPDEKVIENSIVQNIKKFILAIGSDFSFIGNQYRIILDEEEYFIDLLFFNRQLQSLVAIELKRGKFKPEYVGKMNFYLSALDELVKLPHENPSIGIILCKEKNNKVVEFSFRDTNKPMGVSTYYTSNELPEKYRNILPEAELLKKLL